MKGKILYKFKHHTFHKYINKPKSFIKSTHISKYSTAAQEYIVEETDPTRIDKYLTTKLNISRVDVQQLIKNNKIKKNDKFVVKNSDSLTAGDTIVCEETSLHRDIVDWSQIEKQKLEGIKILFEDDHLIVVDKPKGMVVHPSPGSKSHQHGTLINSISNHTTLHVDSTRPFQPGVVHRIDKDTSGVLVLAKSAMAYESLCQKFRNHDLERKYTCLVHGIVPLENTIGTLEDYIGKHPKDVTRQSILPRDSADAKKAITHYKVIERFNNNSSQYQHQQHSFSLVENILVTGKTHQIRVQMSHMGNSVFCDPLYGPEATWSVVNALRKSSSNNSEAKNIPKKKNK
eukprot:TRINITY_DN2197_c0_g1_i1.p1 TRINITY_DN2197_c0_g1~~TRINITY_DN2197_c0_g1_i1.p1  ORF type:complete len:344 (+),score=87.10 TRINITY_DN2197_c0_g1_i1:1-1032(+)